MASAEAGDVAEALGLAREAALEAAGCDPGGWDLAKAVSEVQPAGS